MSSRSVVTITAGSAGSGKTWRRGPHYLVNEFLPEHTGRHWSNFPLRVDELAAFVEGRKGVDVVSVVDRVRLIPEDVLAEWRDGISGPWDFFATADLSDAHIAIDEAHHYCGSMIKAAQQKQWQAWLGEIRHRGATVEFLSQHVNKIAKVIDNEAAVRISLVNSEERRDPWFGILLRDWYELRAKFVGEYRACVWEIEKRQVDGRWKVQDKRVFWLEPEYFALYDSFSAPQKGGKAGKATVREFQRRSWVSLLWWFFRRNLVRVGSRVLVVLFVVWLCFFGGFNVVFNGYMKSLQKGMGKAVGVVGSGQGGAGQGGAGQGGAGPTAAPPLVDPKYRDAVQKLVLTIEEGREENRELRGRLANLEKVDRESREFVCFFPGGAADSFGNTYFVGEPIKDGPFKGEAIKFVDVPRRSVVFSSGRAVVLRRRLQVVAADGRLTDEAAIPGNLPRAIDGDAAEGVGGGERVRAARHGQRPGPGGWGVRPVVSTVDRGLGGGGFAGRGPAGEPGNSGSVGRGLPRGSGTQGWDSSSADWQSVLSGPASAGGPRGVGPAGTSVER